MPMFLDIVVKILQRNLLNGQTDKHIQKKKIDSQSTIRELYHHNVVTTSQFFHSIPSETFVILNFKNNIYAFSDCIPAWSLIARGMIPNTLFIHVKGIWLENYHSPVSYSLFFMFLYAEGRLHMDSILYTHTHICNPHRHYTWMVVMYYQNNVVQASMIYSGFICSTCLI